MKYFVRYNIFALMILGIAVVMPPVVGSAAEAEAPADTDNMNEGGEDDFGKMFDFDSEEFQNLIRQMESHMQKIEDNLPPEKKEALDNMKKRTQELSEKLEEVDQDVTRYSSEKADLKTQVKELRARNADLKSDKDKLIAAIDVLSDDAEERASKQEELDEVENQLTENETELEQKRKEKRGVKAHLKEKEEEYASTEKELEDEQAKGEQIFEGIDVGFDDSTLSGDEYADISEDDMVDGDYDYTNEANDATDDDNDDADNEEMPADQFNKDEEN